MHRLSSSLQRRIYFDKILVSEYERHIIFLSDTDISFGLFNLFTYLNFDMTFD